MAKIEPKSKYARVMHHIGGLTGKNDNSEMIRGGEDELNLVTADTFENLGDDQIKRLFDLGALREATPDEIKRWEVSQGLRDDSDDESFVFSTTGNENLKGEPGAVQQGAGSNEAGTQGELQKAKTADELAAAAQALAAGNTGGASSTGHEDVTGTPGTTYKGMGKGELSEYTVPELKDFAKEESIEGYQTMLKPELLDALLSTNKR